MNMIQPTWHGPSRLKKDKGRRRAGHRRAAHFARSGGSPKPPWAAGRLPAAGLGAEAAPRGGAPGSPAGVGAGPAPAAP